MKNLSFEGELPEGWVLEGAAVLRATRKDPGCAGLVNWTLRNTFFADQKSYPRRLKTSVFQQLPGGRYRLDFRFSKADVGGPCRYQLTTVQIEARGIPGEAGALTVYRPRERSLNSRTQIWESSSSRQPERHVVTCLGPKHDQRIAFECDETRANEEPIPSFQGSLTVPLDVVVPGGLPAILARRRAEQALSNEERQDWPLQLELREAQQQLELMDRGAASDDGVTDAPASAQGRAALAKRIDDLKAEVDRRAALRAEKHKHIVAEFERTAAGRSAQ